MAIRGETAKNLYTLFKTLPKSSYRMIVDWRNRNNLIIFIESTLLHEAYKINYDFDDEGLKGFDDHTKQVTYNAQIINIGINNDNKVLLNALVKNYELILAVLNDLQLMEVEFRFYDADWSGEDLDGNDVLKIDYPPAISHHDDIFYKLEDGKLNIKISTNLSEIYSM